VSPTLRRTKAEGVRNLGAERIFGSKVGEVRGNWRKLHNWSLHDVHCAANIVTVIKLWRMIGVGHLGWSIYTYGVLFGDLTERDNMGDIVVDGRITLIRTVGRGLDSSGTG
jgi:hypothetical protein